MSAINYSELTYERPSEEYVYPDWAVGIGWALASSSALCIPIYAIYITCKFTIVEGKVSVGKGHVCGYFVKQSVRKTLVLACSIDISQVDVANKHDVKQSSGY